MEDSFYHGFLPIEEWRPPQSREEFLFEISLVQRELDLNKSCMDRLTREIKAQGGDITEEQQETIFWVQDSNMELESSIIFYEEMLKRLELGLHMPF
ncbi:hypothetical protein CJU89_5884 [Yarrowia sp. B02]|nr:hypothetical protein CJU89_5884 [Yarrowia sp. B02]